MDHRLAAYIAGLQERMAIMKPAERRKLIAAIHRTGKEPVSPQNRRRQNRRQKA